MPVATWESLVGRMRAHFAVPLYRNGYSLLVGYGATSVLGLVFWVVAARQADPHDVGIAAALFSLMLLVSGACQLSLNTVLLRFLPVAGRNAQRFVLGCYGLTIAATALAAAAVALLAGVWSDDLSFLATDATWFAAFVVGCAGWSVFALQDSALTGARQAHWVMIENSLYSVARVGLLVPLAALGVGGIFAASVVPALIALLPINLLLFRRLLPYHVHEHADRSEPLRREDLARFVLSNYLGSVFFVLSSFLLPIIVTVVAGATDNAHFYAAWSIAMGVQFIAVSMMSSLLVESSLAQARLVQHSRRALSQTLRLVVPVVIVIVAAAPLLLAAFGPSYAEDASWTLRLLALSAIPNVVIILSVNVARVRQQASVVVLVQAAVCVFGVGLSALFLQIVGITGVGIGWLLSQVVVAASVTPWLVRIVGRRSQPGSVHAAEEVS